MRIFIIGTPAEGPDRRPEKCRPGAPGARCGGADRVERTLFITAGNSPACDKGRSMFTLDARRSTIHPERMEIVVDAEGAETDDAAERERMIRRRGAESAITKIRQRARKHGLDRLTMEEIDAEIAAARAARRK
ncbi:hypothetical protein [Longimicrobium sp.]|uniref:hypothetical protein n=1 Tax=Longimicrobium sp. TaxID=2029185 RepID=UPI002D7FDB64|nr:hypothetical protein [Longimicrobium sp.]